MKKKINLSIVISTYNQVRYISECLDSVIKAAQGINCEIIIADDCSTDGTTEICMGFQKRHPLFISLLKREANLGGNMNYLRAHMSASGEFVAHVDGDDVVMLNKFTDQLNCFVDINVNLVMHSSIYFSDLQKCTHFSGLKGSKNKCLNFDRFQFAIWGPIAVHSSYMYRRSKLDLAKFSPPFMEWSLGMEILKSGYAIYLNKPLIKYRFNPGGQAWTATTSGRSKAYEIHFADIKSLFNSDKLLKPFLYSQVLTNLIAIIKSKSRIPVGMIFWLISNILLFRPILFITSILMRFKIRPIMYIN